MFTFLVTETPSASVSGSSGSSSSSSSSRRRRRRMISGSRNRSNSSSSSRSRRSIDISGARALHVPLQRTLQYRYYMILYDTTTHFVTQYTDTWQQRRVAYELVVGGVVGEGVVVVVRLTSCCMTCIEFRHLSGYGYSLDWKSKQ
jgi:hypothetical protein